MTVLITTDAVGGVWEYSLALAQGFVSAGVGIVLAVVGPGGRQKSSFLEEIKQSTDALPSPAAEPGCVLVDTGLELDWTVGDSAGLRRIAAALAELAVIHDVDSAHLHAPCLADADWCLPTVATAHSCMTTWWKAVRSGPRPAEMAYHHAATQAGLSAAHATIAPSYAFADALAAVYGGLRPLHVIHNGVSPHPVSTLAEREAFILTAGRLWDEGKNISILDRVARECMLPIYAAGNANGPDDTCFQADCLRLLGVLPNGALRDLMAKAAIFAAPSIYEPFGLAVLEAAQAGTPLVLADIPTFRELWADAALFVPPRDTQAWTDTLNALAANEARRIELGRAAMTRAGRYTQSAMVAATLSLHTALQSRAARAA